MDTVGRLATIPLSDRRTRSQAARQVAAAAQPTREGMEALIAKNYAGLRALIARRAGDAETGADLLNEAVCKTWEKWQAGLIRRPEQIAGYVFQVAMNLLRNHRRTAAERLLRRAHTGEFDAMPAVTSRDTEVEDEIAARVKQVLGEMGSARDRMVLKRFYLDEEDKDSICADLGIHSALFDKVMHRARRRLRELFEARGTHGADLFSTLSVL